MADQILTVPEVAAKYRVSKQTVCFWVRTKQIPHNKLGRSVRFDSKRLEEWFSQKAVEVSEK